jgi:hypothetical protein
MPDESYAKLLEVFRGQVRQDCRVDRVVAKSLLVLLQSQAVEPRRDVHAPSPRRCHRRADLSYPQLSPHANLITVTRPHHARDRAGNPRVFAGGGLSRGAHLWSPIDTLSAFSLPSFAGSIAGVASGLPLGFQGGFPRSLLGEFRIAGLLLGF